MSMRINQNVAAYNAYRNLSTNNTHLSKSLEKLSSGFRINRAGDDAAGLVKSESLRAEVRGSQQAVRNAQDGISFLQVAEGNLTEVHAILQRMRELAVDAANTATTDGAAQQAEVDELIAELDAIGTKARFAGKDVFDLFNPAVTGGAALTFQVGAGAGDSFAISTDLRLVADGWDATAAGTTADPNEIGIFGGLNLKDIDLTEAKGLTVDVNGDFDGETASDFGGVSGDSDTAIEIIDFAIAAVSDVRGELGAKQNRLEHTIANLNVAVENLSASESRIRDVDMALEMATFTRHSIMVQAGTAMLAQANAVPQQVLGLLG